MGRVTLPGLIDAHVHLREPGGEHKEEIATGTAAALAGGIVAVLDMPNNSPPVVDGPGLARKEQLFRSRARCDYALFVGAGDEAPPTAAEAEQAVAVKLYLTPTFGPLRLHTLSGLLRIFQDWPAHRPIAVHAEGLGMVIPIGLAQLTGKRVHVCHVARADEIALLRTARERGAPVSCEVTPHHLFLTAADAAHLGPFGRIKPSLGTPADVEALWQNLHVVDLVASDHAPHTEAEKRGSDPPPGVPGVETMLPLLLQAVHESRLTLDRLVELLHDGPRRIYGLTAPDAALEVDPAESYALRGAELHSKCGWTPFEGWRVHGRVRRVKLRAHTAFEDGEVLAPQGFGRPLVWAT